jgi:hypothetical protein
MKQVIWQKQMDHRGRHPWAVIVCDGVVYPFMGADIPGICTVTERSAEGDDQSNTTYRLTIPDTARFVSGHVGQEVDGFSEGLQWAFHSYGPAEKEAILVDVLGAALPEARRFFRGVHPQEAAHLDKVEVGDDLGGDTEEVTFSFGGPTRRQLNAGYWDAPVVVLLGNEEVGQVTPGRGLVGWVVPISYGRTLVLSAIHSVGRNGGYFSFRMRVPKGARVRKVESV